MKKKKSKWSAHQNPDGSFDVFRDGHPVTLDRSEDEVTAVVRSLDPKATGVVMEDRSGAQTPGRIR